MRHETPPFLERRLARKGLMARDVSIELVPAEAAGFAPDEAVFPRGSRVFLTHIPGKPLEAQTQAARSLAGRGYRPVPHLGARNFASSGEYAAHLEALAAAGVEEALFVGGNPNRPRGPLKEAADLLSHPVLECTGIRTACLAAYPEDHPSLARAVMEDALDRKLELCRARGLAPVCVSQFAFDGGVIAGWAARFLRSRPQVPLLIGLAGVTSLPKLIGYARRCGVGSSIAALRSGPGRFMDLVAERDPGDIVDALEKGALAREPAVRLHFFAFGGWRKTLDWIAARRK